MIFLYVSQTKVSSPCHLKRNFNAFDISIEFFVQFQLFSNNGDQSSKKENKPETFQSFSSVVFWLLLRRKEIGQFYKRKKSEFQMSRAVKKYHRRVRTLQTTRKIERNTNRREEKDIKTNRT
jgi:hypothetical protein